MPIVGFVRSAGLFILKTEQAAPTPVYRGCHQGSPDIFYHGMVSSGLFKRCQSRFEHGYGES